VVGQCVTFIQNIEAEQNLMFQCLVHNLLTKVHARPEELFRQNGVHNEHILHYKQFMHISVLQWACNMEQFSTKH